MRLSKNTVQMLVEMGDAEAGDAVCEYAENKHYATFGSEFQFHALNGHVEVCEVDLAR